jgi:4-diphosphocytidyl-2-C-methyl-D-erythritol kinase
MSSDQIRDCLAPAKLNLFLHITGRRADGYHMLQTVFQLLDWGDVLHFTRRDDGVIARKTDLPGVPEADDLVVRAARLLQSRTGSRFGVEIEVEKHLPMGAGLGGGSSDAATVLLALNRLWRLDLSREELQQLALQLGADVPFFVFGRNAFAEGVGETLQAMPLPERFFLVVTPAVHVPTAAIFSEKALTRDSQVLTMTDFLAQHSSAADWPDGFGRNDMQAVVAGKYAEVAKVLEWLSNLAPARMTGSGASVFAAFHSKAEAEMAQAKLPASWKSKVTGSLDSHPLLAFAS